MELFPPGAVLLYSAGPVPPLQTVSGGAKTRLNVVEWREVEVKC